MECRFNGIEVTKATFPAGLREIAISCTKPANAAVRFAINSNWGVFDGFEIPGYNETISTLQNNIASLQNHIEDTESRMRKLVDALNQQFARVKEYHQDGAVDPGVNIGGGSGTNPVDCKGGKFCLPSVFLPVQTEILAFIRLARRSQCLNFSHSKEPPRAVRAR